MLSSRNFNGVNVRDGIDVEDGEVTLTSVDAHSKLLVEVTVMDRTAPADAQSVAAHEPPRQSQG